jgi:hypothetical protein
MLGDKAAPGRFFDALKPYLLRREPTGEVPHAAQIGMSCFRGVAPLDQLRIVIGSVWGKDATHWQWVQSRFPSEFLVHGNLL